MVAITIFAVQLICFKSSSSTKTQQGSVVKRFALPPAASRISSEPQPISLANLHHGFIFTYFAFF